MPGKNQYKADDFISVIPGTGGVISEIARQVGCEWHTAKKYIDEYATVKRVYDDECEKRLDKAESKLHEAVDEGEAWAVKYTLSTKGKARGYTQRQEITGDDGGPIKHRFDLSELSDDDLDKLGTIIARVTR